MTQQIISHIKGTLRMTESKLGGRQLPIAAGYRVPIILAGNGWTASIRSMDVEWLEPGTETSAELEFLVPGPLQKALDEAGEYLVEGQTLDLLEGPNEVAQFEIEEIFLEEKT